MYTLIHGNYYVVGMSPDADSIKFRANNPDHWQLIDHDNERAFKKALNKEDGVVTIRLQGIDALETHYTPPTIPTPKDVREKARNVRRPSKGNHRQPHHLGETATNTFLRNIGYSDIEWKSWGRNTWIDCATLKKPDGSTIHCTDKYGDALPGYVITRDIERNGRPIGWVFIGTPPAADGTQLTPQEMGELMADSENFQLVQQGVVYPFFYMTLPAAMRKPIYEAAQQAQQTGKKNGTGCVWPHDNTINGVDLPDLTTLHEEHAIYPYLFRRIVRQWYGKTLLNFWESLRRGDTLPDFEDRSLDMTGFFDDANPWLFVISEQDFVRLSDVLEVEKNRLKLRVYPYDLIFLS
ncbi:MAG: hypothetical protein AAFU54_09095 [Chloroflexota bacterium]